MKPFLSPSHTAAQVQAKIHQGWALQQDGKFAQALQLYDQVLQLQPRNFDALHLSGVVAIQTRDFRRAVDLITKALKVDRDNASAYNNRGAAYSELKEPDFALLNFNKAIALKPDFEEAYNNRGNVYYKLNQYEAAVADFERAIQLRSDYFEAHNNLANALSDMGCHESALSRYRRALELLPDSSEARWNLGMCLLRLGDFTNGWRHSEARLSHWMKRGWKGAHEQPMWTGAESLEGKTILLQCEQGLGDTIQFSRYVALVSQRKPARIVMEVQEPLIALLAPLVANLAAASSTVDAPEVEWIPRGTTLPAFDTHCPLLSLPLAFHTELDTIPLPLPGMGAAADKVGLWRNLLGERSGKPRVGIVWSGNATHVDDRKRSMSLQDVVPLLSDEIDWVSLQKEVRESDLAVLAAHPQIRHYGAQQQDFTDAAAMCELLDLVITVDTSVAHLAASVGKPVWILLAYNADWRWMTARTDSPWYPSATLYRQRAMGDWRELLDRVKADLAARFRTTAG